MASAKLTDLSARGTYVTGDLIYVVPSGGATQYKGTINNLAAYAASNLTAVSGVAAVFNSTAANLTISTITSGTLAVSSVGLLNLTGVGASQWTPGAGSAIVSDTSTGIKFGTGTTQKLGFYNATPVAQVAGNTDVLAGLVTLGFRAASSNPPLDLGTGTVTCGALNGTAISGTTVSGTGAFTALSGTAIPAGGTAGSGYKFSSTSNFGTFFGSGAPTLSAAKGSVYQRSDGTASTALYTNTDGSTAWSPLGSAAAVVGPGQVSGRLSLVSGTPVPVTNQAAKTTVYFTPYKGNTISLYDGSNWQQVSFAEVSVAVPSTLFKNFDVFGYLSGGTLAIETLDWSQTTGSITGATNATPVVVTSVAHGLVVGDMVGISGMAGLTSLNANRWIITAKTNDTFTLASSIGNGVYTAGGTWYKINNSRATALVSTTGGVLTKSGDATRLYLGSGSTTGTSGQTEDSLTVRYLFNYYNRVRRPLRYATPASPWTYATNAWRQANGDIGPQFNLLIGVSEDAVRLDLGTICSGTSITVGLAIGIDSTTTPYVVGISTENSSSGVVQGMTVTVDDLIPAGAHSIIWMEIAYGGTATFYGSDTLVSFGLSGAFLA